MNAASRPEALKEITMRKLIAAMKVSLDGKSEGPDGYADWVEAWSDDYGLTDRIDACLLGGRMYPGYEQYWTAIRDAPYQPLPMTGKLPLPTELRWSHFAGHTPHYVLSKSLASAAWAQTTILREVDQVANLKLQPGKDIYLMGGAQLAGSLIDAGLVDELHVITYPLLAGPGQSPFERLGRRRKLELLSLRPLEAGKVGLSYAIT
jgi:dihydrofolate reductase